MPKRKAAAKPDDVTEDANATHPNGQDEPPAKKPRGRPKSSQKEPDPKTTETKDVKKPGKRGRPKGSRTSGEHGEGKDAHGSAVTSNDELAPSTSKPKPRGRKAESALTDGEFKYTPTRSRKSLEKGKDPERDQPDVVPETQPEVGEPILSTPTPRRSLSPTKSGYNRLAIQRALQNSPSKRKPDGEGDPELRRRIGELTRRCDTLENRYNRLRDVGVVQANANMEKLQKQCETITEGMSSDYC